MENENGAALSAPGPGEAAGIGEAPAAPDSPVAGGNSEGASGAQPARPAEPVAGGGPLAEYRLEQQLARGRALLEKELRVIGALDPAVRTVADLRAAPEFEWFDRLVKEGLAISDAYKLACFDRLGRQQAAAARQAAINAARSKEHLAPVGGGEDPQDGLTDEIIENYRQYNPRWTRAQIAAFHRSYRQGV